MGWGRILPVVGVLWGSAAAAQAPWPAQQPQQQQQAPWPGAPQQQQQKQAAWPAPQQQQPQQQPQHPAAWPSQSAPPAGAPPLMAPAPGMMGGPGGGGQPPPCFEEFTKLRGEVEKRGAAAKVANEKHAAREEFCKVVAALANASNKWAKFTAAKASSCGIPSEAVTQIKAQDEHLAKLKEQVCNAAAAPAGPGGPPSLSEALGTDKLPLDDSEKATVKRGGVLDSLTGTPIR
jgi:hypothetical protein